MKRYVCSLFICSIAAVLFLNSVVAHAEDSSYQAMSDHFFSMVKAGKNAEGVDYLLDTNAAMKKIPDTVNQLKSQFGSLETLMGSYVSHTKLIETKVADMFVYQHYFVAFDRQPISVRISYYKPAGKWICYGLQFDANLTDEIQKKADDNLRFDTQY
jgi:hypothetical protein